MNTRFLLAFLLFAIIISVLGRLLPHPPNFAPIAALALFAGVYAAKISKWYLCLPLAAMLVSDLFLGFYEPKIMAVVYASFFAIGLIGLLIRMFEVKLQTVVVGALSGSMLFYFTTNFAVWAFSGMYPPTFEGLMLSYFMAFPFLKFTLLGDLFYVGLFFGAYEFVKVFQARRLTHQSDRIPMGSRFLREPHMVSQEPILKGHIIPQNPHLFF